MSTQVQFRRGTAAQHNSFVGAPGEITVDTTNNNLRVHDGVTPGGHPLTLQSLFNAHLAETAEDLNGVHGLNYGEGIWTPELRFGGATTGIAYSSRVGLYRRLNNIVFLSFAITLSNKGTATGGARLYGLPFNFNTNPPSTFSPATQSIAKGNQEDISGIVSGDNVRFRVVSSGTLSDLTDSQFSNSSYLTGSLVATI